MGVVVGEEVRPPRLVFEFGSRVFGVEAPRGPTIPVLTEATKNLERVIPPAVRGSGEGAREGAHGAGRAEGEAELALLRQAGQEDRATGAGNTPLEALVGCLDREAVAEGLVPENLAAEPPLRGSVHVLGVFHVPLGGGFHEGVAEGFDVERDEIDVDVAVAIEQSPVLEELGESKDSAVNGTHVSLSGLVGCLALVASSEGLGFADDIFFVLAFGDDLIDRATVGGHLDQRG